MMNIEEQVKKIIEQVRNYGDDAVVRYTRTFDDIEDFSRKDIKLKIKKIKLEDKNFIDALEIAINNVKKFHSEEYKILKKFWLKKYNNICAGQKFVPVSSVGVYVPGGKYGYNYISTLLMTIIPAKVAGVKKIVVSSPPKNFTKYFIYTLYRLGINEVYKVGGAQAIASLAFGTETIPKVDLIIGPGNIWVTEAKRQLVGVVGIDLLAGPSEVVVVADDSYDVEDVVFELLAQAEHDKNAKGYLISLNENFARKVREYIDCFEKEFAKQVEIIFEPIIQKACKLIDKIAPEHLTLLVENQEYFVKNVKNAGAIFYGENPSAVFGDYIAGPSHVLPTNTTSRFSSGLCVASFFKKISIVKFTKKSTKILAKHTSKLAEMEGMNFHKNRVIKIIKNYTR